MKRKPIKATIIYDLPEERSGVIDVADRRTAEILKFWANRGDFDLSFLVRSAYLQGVEDGAVATEKRIAREVQASELEH